MSLPLPTDEQVRTAMEAELAESKAASRRATVTNVEKNLRVTHATFYRNYPNLIEWFKTQLADQRRSAAIPKDTTSPDDENVRLRRENSDLRKQVRIYAEAIRQLTLEKANLEDKIQGMAGVTSLSAHRRQHDRSP